MMSTSRKRFWDSFEKIQEDFDRFFEHYSRARGPAFVIYRERWSPPSNVYDAGDSIRVLVEVAGISRDALDLRIEDNRLVLHGMRPEPCAPPKCNYQQMEIAFGEFELEVPLDVPVDAEATEAWYQDGFLHVVLPKIPQPKPRRIMITVEEKHDAIE
ncbi:MAG: Spore protein SP21 [bacterium ADurb.Bin429]|nr:MAG: Spore protein SP21 [bacterium ADurb.Bin429]